MRQALRRGLLALIIAAPAGCKPPPFTGVGPSPGIGVMVGSGANLSVGSTTQVQVTVARTGGYTGTIDVSIEGLPTGISAAFVPATVPANSTASVLTLRASATAALGIVNATVRGHADGVGDATVQLVITVTQ
jgi:hypothetical protein